MKKERFNLKWILIVFLVTSFLAPAQSAFASNWAFKSHRGNSPKHHYYNQHRHNRYRGNSPKQPYYNQHRYNRYRNNRQRAFRYRNNYHTRYRYNAHFGHNHGLIVSLPFNSRALFVRNQNYYHYHGVYYKKSVCGYYVVPDPH
jgi:hypothetical protein